MDDHSVQNIRLGPVYYMILDLVPLSVLSPGTTATRESPNEVRTLVDSQREYTVTSYLSCYLLLMAGVKSHFSIFRASKAARLLGDCNQYSQGH